MSCSSCGSIVNKGINIAKGLYYAVTNNPEVKIMADRRLLICSTCPMSKVAVVINDRNIGYCNECKCLLDAKVRVEEEKCPLNKW